jgi:predicted 2-oxoglutarate/Fe(II)-dependent dioxygenase YbiX
MKYEIEVTDKEHQVFLESAKKIGKTVEELATTLVSEYAKKFIIPQENEDFVTIIKGYLSPEKCDEFTAMMKKSKEDGRLSAWGDALVLNQPNMDARKFTTEHVAELMQLCKETYGYDKTLYKEQAYFFLWPVGAEHQPHFDNNFLAFEQQGISPELHPDSPEIIFSSILYLNDDWEGGEIYFPKLNKTIRPEKGDLVYFPSDSIVSEHGVKKIDVTDRITFAAWLQREDR